MFLFGISMLSPCPFSSSASFSSSLHPFLQLLGLSDQELQEQMAKGYSYAFNMGNNNTIPFQDFQEAVKVLMERNMPDVLLNRQKEAVIMPETHLPNMPRVVDEQSYREKKMQLDASSLKLLEMKQGKEDLQVARGDLVEKALFQELHKFYKNNAVVVFWGPKLRLPGKDKGSHQEFDFVIIDLMLKAVIGIESKATLNEKALGEPSNGICRKIWFFIPTRSPPPPPPVSWDPQN